MADLTAKMQFRDPARARALGATLQRLVDGLGSKVSVMHVCCRH
jgi:hypothetical protein